MKLPESLTLMLSSDQAAAAFCKRINQIEFAEYEGRLVTTSNQASKFFKTSRHMGTFLSSGGPAKYPIDKADQQVVKMPDHAEARRLLLSLGMSERGLAVSFSTHGYATAYTALCCVGCVLTDRAMRESQGFPEDWLNAVPPGAKGKRLLFDYSSRNIPAPVSPPNLEKIEGLSNTPVIVKRFSKERAAKKPSQVPSRIAYVDAAMPYKQGKYGSAVAAFSPSQMTGVVRFFRDMLWPISQLEAQGAVLAFNHYAAQTIYTDCGNARALFSKGKRALEEANGRGIKANTDADYYVLCSLLESGGTLEQVPRERNTIADCLARYGITHQFSGTVHVAFLGDFSHDNPPFPEEADSKIVITPITSPKDEAMHPLTEEAIHHLKDEIELKKLEIGESRLGIENMERSLASMEGELETVQNYHKILSKYSRSASG